MSDQTEGQDHAPANVGNTTAVAPAGSENGSAKRPTANGELWAKAQHQRIQRDLAMKTIVEMNDRIGKMEREGDAFKARVLRDQSAAPWHKGINHQLDVLEQIGAVVHEAECALERYVAPELTKLGVAKLSMSGDAFKSLNATEKGKEDFVLYSGTQLIELKPVADLLREIKEKCSEREAEMNLVKLAPSAKVGYKALEMRSAAALNPAEWTKLVSAATKEVEGEGRNRRQQHL